MLLPEFFTNTEAVWAVWNFFFLLGSLPLNLVYIGIFATVQAAFTLVAAGYLVKADAVTDPSKAQIATNILIAGGAFAFASGMLGFYTVANLMCQEALNFSFPMGDTSRFFLRGKKTASQEATEDMTRVGAKSATFTSSETSPNNGVAKYEGPGA